MQQLVQMPDDDNLQTFSQPNASQQKQTTPSVTSTLTMPNVQGMYDYNCNQNLFTLLYTYLQGGRNEFCFELSTKISPLPKSLKISLL